ncbi:hypothetical protein ACT7C1_16915, partial [Bacillus paranthracis]
MMEKYIQKLIPEISKISSKTLQVSFNIKVKEIEAAHEKREKAFHDKCENPGNWDTRPAKNTRIPVTERS